jgi:hypothetical protein
MEVRGWWQSRPRDKDRIRYGIRRAGCFNTRPCVESNSAAGTGPATGRARGVREDQEAKQRTQERKYSTLLVDEAVEAGAARAAVEPEHDGVPAGVALRLHQVVEEAPPVRLVHRHVPREVPRRQRASEPRHARHLRARRRRVPPLRRRQATQQQQEDHEGRGGHLLLASVTGRAEASER